MSNPTPYCNTTILNFNTTDASICLTTQSAQIYIHFSYIPKHQSCDVAWCTSAACTRVTTIGWWVCWLMYNYRVQHGPSQSIVGESCAGTFRDYKTKTKTKTKIVQHQTLLVNDGLVRCNEKYTTRVLWVNHGLVGWLLHQQQPNPFHPSHLTCILSRPQALTPTHTYGHWTVYGQ